MMENLVEQLVVSFLQAMRVRLLNLMWASLVIVLSGVREVLVLGGSQGLLWRTTSKLRWDLAHND